VLKVNEEIEALAREYFAALHMAKKSKIDAFHLAVAAWHKMDFVLSWNCKHIAGGRVQKCGERGLRLRRSATMISR
jgi:hypothetical protein